MFTKRRGLIAAVLGLCLPLLVGTSVPTQAAGSGRTVFEITVKNVQQLRQVVYTGADLIDETTSGPVTVIASAGETKALRRTGLPMKYIGDAEAEFAKLGKVDFTDPVPGQIGTQDFPSGYTGYHNFAEMKAELDRTVAAHSNLAKLSSIGKSSPGSSFPCNEDNSVIQRGANLAKIIELTILDRSTTSMSGASAR